MSTKRARNHKGLVESEKEFHIGLESVHTIVKLVLEAYWMLYVLSHSMSGTSVRNGIRSLQRN